MANVAVVHPTFQTGGAENVCFNVIDTLQDSHRVDLFTLERPNVERLNEQFKTNVSRDALDIYAPRHLYTGFEVCNDLGNRLTGGFFDSNIPLQLAILFRRFERNLAGYDLRISTHGELPLPAPSLQYVHHPLLNRLQAGGVFGIEPGPYGYYNELVTRIAGCRPEVVRQSTLLTNSSWTADQIEQVYATRPTIVPPPVDVSAFDASRVRWDAKENGIITIGRIARDKQPERAIDIVDRLRREGHQVHLHLIGPLGRDERYNERIGSRVADREYVYLEGEISRDRLVQMVESHKWGLHPKPNEHFGIAVAELVAGGAVPLVPGSGGTKEIVGGNERLCYSSVTDAVTKLRRLFSDRELVADVRSSLESRRTAFSQERFSESVATLVSQNLT